MRKTYTPEYRAYVVKLILDEGRKGAAVARELEIPYGTLIRWTEDERKKRNGTGPGEEEVPLTPSEYKKKLAAYEKEIRSDHRMSKSDHRPSEGDRRTPKSDHRNSRTNFNPYYDTKIYLIRDITSYTPQTPLKLSKF